MKKKLYECLDGPWKGQKLALSDGTTGVFTLIVNSVPYRGRYNAGKWEPK